MDTLSDEVVGLSLAIAWVVSLTGADGATGKLSIYTTEVEVVAERKVPKS